MTQVEAGPPIDSDIEAAPPKLRRNPDDKVVAGVCGGLGRYFGVDPVFFRLAFVVLAIGGGSGVLLYIVAWLIIPEEKPGESVTGERATLGSQGPAIAGVVLIAVGLMLLVNNVLPWFDKVMWPAMIVAGGLVLIYMGGRRERT